MNRLTLIAAFTAALTPAFGGIIFTKEAPGVQTTTVVGATIETFDSLALGQVNSPFVSPIGTYSAGGRIVSGDLFGGTNQSMYIAVGAQSGTTDFSIDFGKDIYYFGFYWPAGDALNEVKFFDGADLVKGFKVADIVPSLTSNYYCNPNIGGNCGEPYVYLNFTATGGSKFTSVNFHNNGTGTGFETDNHAIYDQPIDPPGVPEPSTWAMLATGIGALAVARRRS